jgi:rhamnose transport system ATP-binding protein
MPEAVLRARSITKAFGGVCALKEVSFDLFSGEVHALVGENGAGKSTLIRIMTGAILADSGTLTVAGQPVQHNSPVTSRSLGIAAIYQQPAIFPDLSVAENIALTLESGSAWRRVNWKERNRRAAELIERTGAALDPERLAGALSMPEQQIMEIAKAIGAEAKIVIMDEPTASLSDREVERLFRIIASLRGEGAGIIYISHRLEEISAIADRITVLRDGEIIATRNREEVDRAALIRMMAGVDISAVFPARKAQPGAVVLETRGLSSQSAGVHNVSLSVRAGEILGIAGLVGSGRTQLAETLFGLTPADSGEILLQGKPIRIDSPAGAISAGIGYVPEDRRRHGVIAGMSVAANTSLASLIEVSRNGLIISAKERELALEYLNRFRIKPPSIHSEVGFLSGGNQQKVALARWLATHPRVLILDEPTQGVDIGAKAEIHRLMAELASRGLAIIMISSELPEILGMSDRIAVMRNGAVFSILSREQATQEKVLSLALGHSPAGERASLA